MTQRDEPRLDIVHQNDRINKRIALLIAESIGGNHVCTFIYGSRARGDFNDKSDLDLVIICHAVTSELLEVIGKVCLQQKAKYEINPQVVTENEFSSYPNELGAKKLGMEGRILVGSYELPTNDLDEYRNIGLDLITQCLMSVRHYIVSREASRLSKKKLDRYIKKPLLHGLRYYFFSIEGVCYSNSELIAMHRVIDTHSLDKLQVFLQHIFKWLGKDDRSQLAIVDD